MTGLMRWLKAAHARVNLVDWFIAWFGGSATTALMLHAPALGWIFAGAVVVLVGWTIGLRLTRPSRNRRAS